MSKASKQLSTFLKGEETNVVLFGLDYVLCDVRC